MDTTNIEDCPHARLRFYRENYTNLSLSEAVEEYEEFGARGKRSKHYRRIEQGSRSHGMGYLTILRINAMYAKLNIDWLLFYRGEPETQSLAHEQNVLNSVFEADMKE